VSSIRDLPDDIETLKRLIIDQQAKLAERDHEIEHLKLLIAKFRRLQYGRSSEKLDAKIAQLELLVEELEANRASGEARTPQPPAAKPEPKQRPARRPLPEHLPRETLEHVPACACPECGATMNKIGEDVAEMLEYVPASFKVIRHVRPKLACARCQAIVQVPAPSRPIARGIAGAGLLAHILVAKYADHLPLYRQSQILKPARAWRSSAPPWLTASEAPPRCSIRWSKRSRATWWAAHTCTATTPRYRCSSPGAARPRLGGCGPMCETVGRGPTAQPRRCCSATRPTAGASTPKRT
jgi:transposase